MIKITCGISRESAEPDAGPEVASVNAELELENTAAQDTDVLREKIRDLFAIARNAVEPASGIQRGSRGSDPGAV